MMAVSLAAGRVIVHSSVRLKMHFPFLSNSLYVVGPECPTGSKYLLTWSTFQML